MRSLHQQLFIFVLLLLFTCSRSIAQEVPRVIQFKRTDYNAAHQNWMMAQDCEGYLYVANTDGVLVFNGFQWQHVSLPQNQNPRAVFLGKDCKVYTGAYETFGYIDLSDRNHPVYQPVADTLLKGSSQEIWSIFGNDEQIIFQSFSNIYSYDYSGISAIVPPSNIMLGKTINGELYVPKIEQGLYKIAGDQILEQPAAMMLPKKEQLADLCAASQAGEIVLGTQYSGLFVLGKNSLRAIDSDLNERLKDEQINKLIRLKSGSYVIGTILNGVYITDDFVTVKYHLTKSNGLSHNTVLSLFEDATSNLWVGLDKGLNLLKTSDPIRYFYDRQGKLGTVFTTIYYQNILYLGTNQGVFKAKPDGSFALIDDSQGQIWSFIEVDGDLICGHNNGTYLIKDDKFIQISDITGGWCMEAIAGNRILQSTYTGLVVLEKKGEKWELASRVKDGNILIERFALFGEVLVGHHPNYGVSVLRLSPQFDQVTQKTTLEKIDGIDCRKAVPLLDSESGIVLLLESGYYLLKGNAFVKMTIAEIAEMEKSPRFAAQRKFYQSISEISRFENISNYQYFRPDYQQATFILGFDDGYLTIPWSFEVTAETPDQIAVDYVTVNGQLWKDTSSLFLHPSENDVSVQIKDLSFNNRSVPLQYQLKNWDDQWHDIPPDGQLDFINLDDGDYELFLKASAKIPARKLLRFTIQPHWYESWLGGIVYAALAFLLAWYLDKRNQRKIRLQTEHLQTEKVRELESERMKAKNDKLEREIIYKSKMLANSTMALVQKNKMLNELKLAIAKEDLKDINNKYYKQKILTLLDRNISSDTDWEIFEQNFAEVHEDFLEKLKANFPDITAGELKLAAYIRMNLSSKEIAPLLNISVRSVENKRYRLRKKMGIAAENSLSDYLLRL